LLFVLLENFNDDFYGYNYRRGEKQTGTIHFSALLEQGKESPRFLFGARELRNNGLR